MIETMLEINVYLVCSALFDFTEDKVVQTRGYEYHIAIHTHSFTFIRNVYYFFPMLAVNS